MPFSSLKWLSDDQTPVPLVTDLDLVAIHPRITGDLWDGSTSYRTQLMSAFSILLNDLASIGYVSSLIENSEKNRAFSKRAVIARTFVLIFTDFITDKNDRWDVLASKYQREYDKLLSSASLDYDADNNGSSDAEQTTAPITLLR